MPAALISMLVTIPGAGQALAEDKAVDLTRAVIVTLPTGVLAEEKVRFSPGLPAA